MVDGYRYTGGRISSADFVPELDSYVARRIHEAGFVIVGKTNLPEFGILPVREPRRYGAVRNP